ncbi:MAG: ABC transporter substrate-binding protein, partial [Hyphomicrobiales bacterium]|nr:ABC transporter substrate-binding protein [Hyphomicrobiales bacterium]
DDKSREFGNRFFKRTGRMPNMVHAGTYSAVTQYLKAVKAVGSDDAEKVAKKLHEMPVDDFFAKGGKVLPNGRMVHDMYLFQVKTPEESKGEWDLYKLLATVPGPQAYFTFEDSGCKLTN